MNRKMYGEFSEIAALDIKDIGFMEENAKIKVVVPLLLSLGHKLSQLDFEHSGIDIFIKGLPPDCQVIVETKSLSENLDAHLAQLSRYAKRTKALLAVISNGDEIRIYFGNFVEVPLYSVKRQDLTNNEIVNVLKQLLSRESLVTKKVHHYVLEELEKVLQNVTRKYGILKNALSAQKRILESRQVNRETKEAILLAQQEGLFPAQQALDELGSLFDGWKQCIARLEKEFLKK